MMCIANCMGNFCSLTVSSYVKVNEMKVCIVRYNIHLYSEWACDSLMLLESTKQSGFVLAWLVLRREARPLLKHVNCLFREVCNNLYFFMCNLCRYPEKFLNSHCAAPCQNNGSVAGPVFTHSKSYLCMGVRRISYWMQGYQCDQGCFQRFHLWCQCIMQKM